MGFTGFTPSNLYKDMAPADAPMAIQRSFRLHFLRWWAPPLKMAIEHGPFIVDLPLKNGDFPIKDCVFPIKNGDFPIKKWWFSNENVDSWDLMGYKWDI